MEEQDRADRQQRWPETQWQDSQWEDTQWEGLEAELELHRQHNNLARKSGNTGLECWNLGQKESGKKNKRKDRKNTSMTCSVSAKERRNEKW